MYDTTKRSTWSCHCGKPTASAGNQRGECAEHFPFEGGYEETYFPLVLNVYQAASLLRTLDAHPELSSGDWFGELQLLLRNQGITHDTNMRFP